LVRRLGWPQSRSEHSGEEKNIQPRRESNPRTPIMLGIRLQGSYCPLLGFERLKKIYRNMMENVDYTAVFQIHTATRHVLETIDSERRSHSFVLL
jgi:hypothetical protein